MPEYAALTMKGNSGSLQLGPCSISYFQHSIFGSYDLAIGSYDFQSAVGNLAIRAKQDMNGEMHVVFIVSKGKLT